MCPQVALLLQPPRNRSSDSDCQENFLTIFPRKRITPANIMVVLESAFDTSTSMETCSLPTAMQLSVDTSASGMSIPTLSTTPDLASASLACSMKMMPKRFINLHSYFNPLSSLSLKKQIKQVAVSDDGSGKG